MVYVGFQQQIAYYNTHCCEIFEEFKKWFVFFFRFFIRKTNRCLCATGWDWWNRNRSIMKMWVSATIYRWVSFWSSNSWGVVIHNESGAEQLNAQILKTLKISMWSEQMLPMETLLIAVAFIWLYFSRSFPEVRKLAEKFCFQGCTNVSIW